MNGTCRTGEGSVALRAATSVMGLVDDVAAEALGRGGRVGGSMFRRGAVGGSFDAPTAVAAVLLEVAEADRTVSPQERWVIECVLQREFGLAPVRASRVLRAAERLRREVAGVWVFTHRLVESLAEAQRNLLGDLLWTLARADGEPDWEEQYAVRKLSALLRVEAAGV